MSCTKPGVLKSPLANESRSLHLRADPVYCRVVAGRVLQLDAATLGQIVERVRRRVLVDAMPSLAAPRSCNAAKALSSAAGSAVAPSGSSSSAPAQLRACHHQPDCVPQDDRTEAVHVHPQVA